jgi:hypothetical protein
LLPVRCGEDGWPVFGDGGKTVDRLKKPGVAKGQPVGRPASDIGRARNTLTQKLAGQPERFDELVAQLRGLVH